MNKRKAILFAVDTLMILAAAVLSFLFRFDFSLPSPVNEIFGRVLLLILVVKPMAFLTIGFYRHIWRYASLRDIANIIKTVSVASLAVAAAIAYLLQPVGFPRSILVLDWVLLLFLGSASRLAWRYYRELRQSSESGMRPRALIIGAGEAGSLLLKEIRRKSCTSYEVVGFLDDDKGKQGMLLHGVKVLGRIAELNEIVNKYGIREVIIAIPSARGKLLQGIVERCKTAGVRFRTLPGIGDIIDGRVSISQIRDVEIADLLGREPVNLDKEGISGYLRGKRVLVSGAAGSIGSEICRQVANFSPECLIMLDNAETPLFFIERELSAKRTDLWIVPVIGDVKNREKLDLIFVEYKPHAVFHAAAYKHVPMMECNPVEAVANNIGGTMAMANAAHRHGAGHFVLISTDKAVNPANVMGATKRAAEIYVRSLACNSRTNFSAVRFGNVLGSNGSVIPLFMEQIRKGGPVTVTDPDVIRYFMTIPEASQLVLQAGCLGEGGEIFLLDMGEPVRIVELAEELIRLSGFVPYEDIEIVFTGLRPGEKLYEELFFEGEGITRTSHDKIRVVDALEAAPESVNTEMYRLLKLADEHNVAGVMNSLCGLVPEFTPGNDCEGSQAREKLDKSRDKRNI